MPSASFFEPGNRSACNCTENLLALLKVFVWKQGSSTFHPNPAALTFLATSRQNPSALRRKARCRCRSPGRVGNGPVEHDACQKASSFCAGICLLVVDGVQALEDHDLVGLDELRWVLAAALQERFGRVAT